MARSGWVKPVSERRLSDLVSVGLLTRVFPAGVVDEVIAAAGRTELRHRALPARVMAYFSIGMALYSEDSYEDVFAQLTDGSSWSSGSPPSKSGIFQTRVRLGFEPMRDLFTRVARPLAGPDMPGSWLAGRRLVTIDGTVLDLADSAANAEFFGRPASGRGEKSAFPQARVAECGTDVILDAEVGPCTTSEIALSRELLGRLVGPGRLWLLWFPPMAACRRNRGGPALAGQDESSTPLSGDSGRWVMAGAHHPNVGSEPCHHGTPDRAGH